MRLPKPFYRLPVRFDVERMRVEVSALSATSWAKHPNSIEGNSSVRLISVGGGENDDVKGTILPPPDEVDLLVTDLRGELELREDTPAGRSEYHRLLDGLRTASRTLAEGLITRTNSVAAHLVLEGRLLDESRTCRPDASPIPRTFS